MKKLEKKNHAIVDSLETYLACVCSCSCYCVCNCDQVWTHSGIGSTNNSAVGRGSGGSSSYSIQQVANGQF